MLKIEADLLDKTTIMKAMNLHVEHLEEKSRKIAVDNKIILVTKEAIISLSMNRLRLK